MATAYTLAYGGGLVAGDVVSLDVDVDAGCGLVLLTQGSTKVFKHRPGIRPMSHRIIRDGQLGKDSCTVGHAQDKEGPAMRGQGQRLCDGQAQLITRQRMLIKLGTGSLCILMPDSVSPFRSSRYSQAQRFVLPADRSASLLVLDWVNSGRGYRGPGRTFIDGDDREVWAMNFYGSTNEVLIGDQFIMRERLVLDNDQCHGPAKANDPHGSSAPNQQPQRSENLTKVARQLAPYHVYGSLLILGPAFAPLVAYLNALIDHTSQMQIHTPPSLLWSYSSTDEQGGVLRLAAEEVEDAQRWLREVMTFAGVQHVVGEGLWPRVI
jgi:urease accessory protein